MVDKTLAGLASESNQSGANPASSKGQDEGNPSDEFVTKVTQIVAPIINAAITNRNKSFESKLEEKFARFEQLLTKDEPKAEDQKPKKAEDPQVAAALKEVERLKAKEAKVRDAQLRASVRERFLKGNVNPDAVDALLALHIDSKKAIGYAADDSDDIIFKLGDETVSLDEGVGSWLKTDSAKAFLAPKGATGSGDKNYSNPSPTSKGGAPSEQEFANRILGMFSGK